MESALSKEIIEWSREDLHGARMQPMEKTKGKKRVQFMTPCLNLKSYRLSITD